MQQLESKNSLRIHEIKATFFGRLALASSGIAFVFSIYFVLLLTLPVVGMIELGFSILFAGVYYVCSRKILPFKKTVQIWLVAVGALLLTTSSIAGGLKAPGIFWFPALVYSVSVLLDRKATVLWASVCFGVVIGMLALTMSGFEFPNFQKESVRYIAHFMNVFMILIYVSAFSLLSIRLRAVNDELNHKILTDLYNENRLKSLSQVVGGVAHEINNPLTISVLSVMQVKRKIDLSELSNDPRLVSDLRTIEKSNQRMAVIVNQLRQFNRKEFVEVTQIRLVRMVEEVLEFMQNTFLEQRVEVRNELRDEEFFIEGNEGQLQQVLLNVLKNAIDAMESTKNKKIRVEIEVQEDIGIVRISDNGHGLSEDDQEKVFDPFYTTKPVGKGSGLGLSISQNIIRNMGGEIRLYGNSEHGATIEISLPEVRQDNQAA